MKFIHLFIVFLIPFAFGATCTDADVKISYGPCINNKRDIVFYVTDCSVAGYNVPAPIRQKECNFSCPAGSFYDLKQNKSDCTNCPATEEADGFAVVYNNLSANNFAPFKSNCSGTGCKNWTVWGKYLTTAFQPVNVRVNLSLTVNIFQTTGKVLFDYTCPETRYQSAELHFYVDGVRVNNISYISDTWKSDSFDLSFGAHDLTWELQTYYSYNEEEIGARLRNIEIRGTKYLVTTCKPCPFGSTSQIGEECKPCSFNRVPVTNCSNGTCVIGACEECPLDKFAYPGDSTCQTRQPCAEKDYYEEYGECINNQRTVTKVLSKPVVCLESSKPNVTSAPCEKCDPGWYKSSSGARCARCADGLYRNENMTDDKCEVCPAGTYATKNDLNIRPEIVNDPRFITGCVSDDKYIDNCATTGWIEEKNYITAGNHFGPVTVFLNRTINTTEYGNLFFSYTTKLRSDSYFKFYSSYYSYLLATRANNTQGKHNFSAPFYSGVTNFTFLFIKTCHDGCPHGDTTEDTVEIDELSISTESIGGGTECTPCWAGTYSEASATSCTACGKGSYSEKNSSSCTQCPEGTYAPYEGSENCSTCLNNTKPNEDRSECTFVDCGFSHNSTYSFSLAAIAELTKDAMINATVPNNETRMVFIDICTMAHSNNTCKDYFDTKDESGDNAYACTVGTGSQYYYSWMLGTQEEMNLLEQRDSDDNLIRYGVNLTYSAGNNQYCYKNSSYQNNSIEILFICVPESGLGEPLPAPIFEDDTCHIHYEWITEYACRICSPADYENLDGACIKGKKNSTWVLKQGQSTCTHGYAPATSWEISSCPNPLVKLSAGAVVGIVLGAVVLLGLAVFFIIYYIRKNRALRYQLFQKGNFSLQVERSDDESAGAGAGGDYAPSSTSMFGGGQEEQYKSVDFSGTTNTDSAY